jgi:hypothetical protein
MNEKLPLTRIQCHPKWALWSRTPSRIMVGILGIRRGSRDSSTEAFGSCLRTVRKAHRNYQATNNGQSAEPLRKLDGAVRKPIRHGV